ncbi:NUDIX hydrolase [Candidatus Nanohalococcus occultus]|uniref:NUDIX hydrolase n=1 Tax=Candidatus Nanohalococcus occultus TaxID=2978047 RepID=UPI0039E0D87F
MTEIRDVAIGALMKEQRVLMVKRSERETSSGKWCLPGGKVEEDETPREAALREIKEETDLEADIVDEGDVFLNETRNGKWRVHSFRMIPENFEVTLNEENSEFQWLTPSDTEELETVGDGAALESLGLK